MRVDADNPWNPIGVWGRAGNRYCFQVSAIADKPWKDWFIDATPEAGWNDWGLLRWMARNPKANIYQLVGEVPGVQRFTLDAAVRMTGDGPLFVYANDLSFMYWNNHGQARLSIVRCADGEDDAACEQRCGKGEP